MQSVALPYEENFLQTLQSWLRKKYRAAIYDWGLAQVKFCPVDEVLNFGQDDVIAEKISKLCPQGNVTNFNNSSAKIPFADKIFNVATNFGANKYSFREVYRVLNIGGIFLIVDDFNAELTEKLQAAGFEIYKTATKNFLGRKKICVVAEK